MPILWQLWSTQIKYYPWVLCTPTIGFVFLLIAMYCTNCCVSDSLPSKQSQQKILSYLKRICLHYSECYYFSQILQSILNQIRLDQIVYLTWIFFWKYPCSVSDCSKAPRWGRSRSLKRCCATSGESRRSVSCGIGHTDHGYRVVFWCLSRHEWITTNFCFGSRAQRSRDVHQTVFEQPSELGKVIIHH